MMQHWLNWVSMGGYAMYVWPSYGLVVFVLIINVIGVKQQWYKTQRALQRWFSGSKA